MLRVSLTWALLVCAAATAAEPADPLEGKRYASQLFLIDARQKSIVTGLPARNVSDAKRYRATQRVLLKSPLVIESAVRSADLSGEGLYDNDSQAVGWVQAHMVVVFPEESQVLQVAIVHPTAPRKAMMKLVEALSKAYMDEVIFETKIRDLKPRDILADSQRDLEEKIHLKSDELHAMLTDSQSFLLPAIAAKVELLKAQIGRLEAERLAVDRDLLQRRVELKLTDLQPEKSEQRLAVLAKEYEAYTKRIEQQIAGLTEEVQSHSEADAGLTALAAEIAGLKQVRAEIAEKIEHLEIELKAPNMVMPFGGVDFHDPSEERGAKRALLPAS